MVKKILSGHLKGDLLVPPSKSDAQRALLSACLAKGNSTIVNPGNSDDVLSMLEVIRMLGANVSNDNNFNGYDVEGINEFPEKLEINVGESGLGARLLAAVCAVHPGQFKISGESSILNREMGFISTFYPSLGVKVKALNDKLPLFIEGPFLPGKYEIDTLDSSQYLSGLLMALPLANSETEFTVHNMTSEPYVRMTIETLKKFGITINTEKNNVFKIKGNQSYEACSYTVQGDWSAASYWIVASALGFPLTINGLSLNSLQADKKILDILIASGFQIKMDENGGIQVEKGGESLNADLSNCPDLFPALVTLATILPGTSELLGVNRLRNKESDRANALVKEFSKMGAKIEIKGNLMTINGAKRLIGAKVSSHGDHRIAMCLAIAALFSEGPVEIENAEVVAKSYPEFWDEFDRLYQH
jgi:3-phosphoshikimate 1-carboxyvinyltransferase